MKLKLLLLAVEEKTGEGEESQISINPKDFKIAPNTVGFFIAQSAEEVKRSVLGKPSKNKSKKLDIDACLKNFKYETHFGISIYILIISFFHFLHLLSFS